MSGLSSASEPQAPSVGELARRLEAALADNAGLRAVIAAKDAQIEVLSAQVAELERRLSKDSSNSSRPPSTDAPWQKKPAKKRSSRSRSGRRPGKQPGAPSSSRKLIDDPDEVVVVKPGTCQACQASLAGAEECSRVRRQVADVQPPPAGEGDGVPVRDQGVPVLRAAQHRYARR